MSKKDKATAGRGGQQVNEAEGIRGFLRRAPRPRQLDNSLDDTPTKCVLKKSTKIKKNIYIYYI